MCNSASGMPFFLRSKAKSKIPEDENKITRRHKSATSPAFFLEHYPPIFASAQKNIHKRTRNPPSNSKLTKEARMGKEGKEMTVVRGVDLQRYMGRWYEIASIPSFFQPKDGVNTRATYSLNDDGTVHVLNETWSHGKRVSIEGSAYKANPNSDEAKLKVKFYVPPFFPIIPVTGNYWVLYLDSEYSVALIGEPTRSYLWILSRTTHIDDATYNLLLEKAKEEGYDVGKLHKTPQADPPPESDDAGPKDKKGIWWIKSLFGK